LSPNVTRNHEPDIERHALLTELASGG